MTSQQPKRYLTFLAVVMTMAATVPGICASSKGDSEAGKAPAPSAAGSEEMPSYEPRLLRLAEILGALSYLQDLCSGPDSTASGQVWRTQMTALLETEGKTAARKERLAGAYNHGFRGYEFGYRRCTTNAQAIITRFLDESGRLARDIAQHAGRR
jgi:uncharacterized protein (TIGR02301 family)